MPLRYDIKPPRPYRVGDFVLTPTGRVARVLGYLGEDRVDLRYTDAVSTGRADEVALPVTLVRPYQ